VNEAVSVEDLRREIEELRASRARVVLGADGERRRIERSLHDGVQQHLVALAVSVQLARELADSDSAGLKALLEQMGQDVRDALESVRLLAHGVYPPLLLDRGVADALRGAAAGLGVALSIEAPAQRYPPDVEAAVFFCCLEALNDAAEQPGSGTRATIRVWPVGETLCFEIVLDREPSADVLPLVCDRLGAVGGRLTVESEPGRARVLGEAPLAP
jgi:signal transduction histidine kinase